MIEYTLEEEIYRVGGKRRDNQEVEQISSIHFEIDTLKPFYPFNHPSNGVYSQACEMFHIKPVYDALNLQFETMHVSSEGLIFFSDIASILIDYLLATASRMIAYETKLKLDGLSKEEYDEKAKYIIHNTSQVISEGTCIMNPNVQDSLIKTNTMRLPDEYYSFTVYGLPLKCCDNISPTYTVYFKRSKPPVYLNRYNDLEGLSMSFDQVNLNMNLFSNMWNEVNYKIDFKFKLHNTSFI